MVIAVLKVRLHRNLLEFGHDRLDEMIIEPSYKK